MLAFDARSALLQGVGHLKFQLGVLVENGAHQVSEGLAIDEAPDAVDDSGIAIDLDKAGGPTCLAFQIPVGERQFAPSVPAAYGFVGFDVLPPAKEHSGSQDILS